MVCFVCVAFSGVSLILCLLGMHHTDIAHICIYHIYTLLKAHFHILYIYLFRECVLCPLFLCAHIRYIYACYYGGQYR